MSLDCKLYRTSIRNGLGRSLVVLIWTQILLTDFHYVKATPGLGLPEERTTGLGCIPVGRNVSYQCTVNDTSDPLIGSTVWSGSAFQCPRTSNQISLLHIQFMDMKTGSCGTLRATALKVNGSNYVSQLNLTATNELNGKTLVCSLGGWAIMGSDVILVGVLPPPPGSLMVAFSSDSFLTVSWSPPSGPVEGGVGGYMFGVTGEGCGCVSMNVGGDTTSVTCSGWTAAGQTCSFEVRTLSQDCGFCSDPTKEEFVACDSAELGGSPSSVSSSGTAVASHGKIVYNGVVNGSVANLICNDGYIPASDSSNRTCMSDGKWSGSVQTCISQSQQDIERIVFICLLLFVSAVAIGVTVIMRYLYKLPQQATGTWWNRALSILSLGVFKVGKMSRNSPVNCPKIWKEKSLKVYFMNPEDITKVKCRGEPMSINTILAWARVWNLVPFPQIPHFEITKKKEEAQIRVEFTFSEYNEVQYQWSLVGNDTETIPNPNRSTMELDLRNFSPQLQESIVINVFGRALGLEDEHQRSDFWDVVEEHLDTEQMKKDRGEFSFKHNLYRKDMQWELSVNYLTDYDPQSIMHLRFEKSWIKDRPDTISGDTKLKKKKRECLRSLLEGSNEGQLPRRPSKSDYERLIKAYGQCSEIPDVVPSTETFRQALQKATNCYELQSQIWMGKDTLNVYFVNPDDIEDWGWKCRGQLIDINAILAWARVWNILPYPNIPMFEMTEKAEKADIQVQFSNAGGIWSKVGMQVTTTSTDPKKMTVYLNLADLDKEPELQESIVIKQFGHALGLKNEHQRSNFWKVIGKYLNVEKMKENPEIESAFVNQWAATSEGQTVNSLSKYDPESITHFRFSVEWIDSEFEESGTIDPYKHPLLSETEIIFLDGLNRRSKLGVLPKRPSINDYEKLQAAYKAQATRC